MAKLTIQEASVHFGISKEAIHNRIRRGSLASVIDHGVKYVIIEEVKVESKVSVIAEDKYQTLLEEQNRTLLQKIERLEQENSALRDQKEKMLVDERLRIEAIYKEKDEQLKNILQTVSTKFLPQQEKKEESELYAEVVEPYSEEQVPLKKYLKSLNISEKDSKRAKLRFELLAFKDIRITMLGGKIFVNPNRYSYNDLL